MKANKGYDKNGYTLIFVLVDDADASLAQFLDGNGCFGSASI